LCHGAGNVLRTHSEYFTQFTALSAPSLTGAHSNPVNFQ
jgi:hypothetical protein